MKRSRLMTYIKLVLTTLVIFPIVNGSIIIVQMILNRWLNTTLAIDFDLISLSFLVPFSLLFSLMMMPLTIYKTKGIRIDERSSEEERIKQAMKKLKWKLMKMDSDTIVFSSPFGLGLWKDEITIRFINNEAYINGPILQVERMISLARFSYEAFDIVETNKEEIE